MSTWLKQNTSFTGQSLVELLIALALLGFVSMSIANFLIKGNVTSASLDARFKEASEVHAWITELREDLNKGVYISDNSNFKRLEYTTYDSSGNALKKIYRIHTDSGVQYLEYSSDNGSNFHTDTPYKLSAYTKYRLTGYPSFLYANAINACMYFNDFDANGVWVEAVDGTPSNMACDAETSSTALTRPSQATKVVLKNFDFSTGTGSPLAIRGLPDDIFIQAPFGPVRSNAAAISPAVKDSLKVQSFDVPTVTFNATFNPYDIAYDASRDRLIIVGDQNKIYVTDRKGVLIGSPLTLSDATIVGRAVALEDDGKTILLLDNVTEKVYRYDITGTSPLSPITTLNMASPTNYINLASGIAYDPSTPTDFYVLGQDPATSTGKIFQRNKSTLALVTSWNVPAGVSVGDGLAIEPTTGDFLLLHDTVSGVSPNKTVTIYRVKRSDNTSTSFTVNLDDLGSSLSAADAWGLSYDPHRNAIFLTNYTDMDVFEIIPPRLISPRS